MVKSVYVELQHAWISHTGKRGLARIWTISVHCSSSMGIHLASDNTSNFLEIFL